MKSTTHRIAGRRWIATLVIGALIGVWGGAPAVRAQDEAAAPDQTVVETDQAPTEPAAEPAPPPNPEADEQSRREQVSMTIEQTRAKLDQWVETRRLISEEKKDLALSLQFLNDRIDVLQSELDAMKQRTAEAQEQLESTDEKHQELTGQNEKLIAGAQSLRDMVDVIEQRTMQLLAASPQMVRERVRPLSQQMPENEEEKQKLSLSARFQNVIGILNEINKFHTEITVTSEVRDLGDGESREVTVMYLGVSKAYYVSASGDVAGVGSPGEDGWVWTSRPEAAKPISQAIAILKNEQVASFVPLPMEIK